MILLLLLLLLPLLLLPLICSLAMAGTCRLLRHRHRDGRARPLRAALALFFTGLITLASPASPALARAAPQLQVPAAPPNQLGCAAGWQTGTRVSAGDGASFALLETRFDLKKRAGSLLRRPIDSGAEGKAQLTVGPPLWDAAAILDSGRPPPAQRRIVTASAAFQTIPFVWSSLDAGQRAALDPQGDGLGEARVGYLRGERDAEVNAGGPEGKTGQLRPRHSLLGDIVRSVPLLVGPPRADEPGEAYRAFYKRYRDRRKLIYVGANDGMLHAFDWDSGEERYAYLPAMLMGSLYRYTAPDTGGADDGHQALVDGAAVQAEAQLSGQWRSVLVSGAGMGARGVFALDVSDPDAGPTVLWEFSDADDGAIGQVHAPPRIVKLRGKETGGASAYRYFVLVSSGINRRDGSADGALFLLALDKPAGVAWREGDNYVRLAAPARDPAVANALAPAVVAVAADGSARTAYAGDLQGAMWRFDLDGLGGPGPGPGAGGAGRARVLFQARAADGTAQAIAEAAQVVHAPGGGYLVLFGTDRAIAAADVAASSFGPQSFYAVRDRDSQPPPAALGRDALAERRLSPAGAGYAIKGERFDYNGGGAGLKQGWYFDFPRAVEEGERNAAAPQLSGTGVLITSTAPGNNPCAPLVRAYIVDAVGGFAHDKRGVAAAGALSGHAINGGDASLPLMLTGHGAAGAATPTGAATRLRTLRLFQLQAGGSATPFDEAVVSTSVGRLSWREIANWRELRSDAGAGPFTLP